MKRLETLQKEAREFLRQRREGEIAYHERPNDVDPVDIARALDRITEARRVLVKAFG